MPRSDTLGLIRARVRLNATMVVVGDTGFRVIAVVGLLGGILAVWLWYVPYLNSVSAMFGRPPSRWAPRLRWVVLAFGTLILLLFVLDWVGIHPPR